VTARRKSRRFPVVADDAAAVRQYTAGRDAMILCKALSFLALIGCLVFLAADQPKPAPVAVNTIIWTTSIESFSIGGGEPPSIRGMFTPDTDIYITRVDAFSRSGPRAAVNGLSGQPVPCSPPPSIALTSGTSSFALPLNGKFLPKSNSTYTDSGPMNLRFTAGAPIALAIVAPQQRLMFECLTTQLNVQVHYKVVSQ
jgi:hypothetical protein